MKTKKKIASGLAALALCGAAMATNTAAVSAQIVNPKDFPPPRIPNLPDPIPVPSGLVGNSSFQASLGSQYLANSAMQGISSHALATGLSGGHGVFGRGYIGTPTGPFGYQGSSGYSLVGGPGPYWWAEAGQAAAAGAAGGAVGGAVSGAVACGAAGAAAGAATGAVAGAVGGAVSYAIGSAFGLAPQQMTDALLEPVEQLEAHQALLD